MKTTFPKGHIPWNKGKKGKSLNHNLDGLELGRGWNKGKKTLDTTKEKISKSNQGKRYSPATEFKKGIVPWNTGKPMPLAHKEKLRQLSIGREPPNKTFLFKECSVCGQSFKVIPALYKTRNFCSRKCFHSKKKEWMVGSKNPLWNGGNTTLHSQIRNSLEYRQWRSDVFHRDQFTCQDCGSMKGGMFEAHHIKPFIVILNQYAIHSMEDALCTAELWDINNGITLCEDCHINRHEKRPYRKKCNKLGA